MAIINDLLPFAPLEDDLPKGTREYLREVRSKPYDHINVAAEWERLKNRQNAPQIFHAYICALVSELDRRKRSFEALKILETAPWEIEGPLPLRLPGLLAYQCVLSLIDYYNSLLASEVPTEMTSAVRSKLLFHIDLLADQGDDFEYGDMSFTLSNGQRNPKGGESFWNGIRHEIREHIDQPIKYPSLNMEPAENHIENHVRERIRRGEMLLVDKKKPK